jgi:hypothetical protein
LLFFSGFVLNMCCKVVKYNPRFGNTYNFVWCENLTER